MDMRLRASTRSRSSTTAASRSGPSATTSGSRASASRRGRRARPATASSTSTTRTTTGAEELYLVTEGRARFELDGESVDAPAGTFVFVRAAAKRTAYAEEAGTTIVAMGATSGKPYEATGWEVWAAIRPIYESGDHAEVVKRLRGIVVEHPEYALLFYNLACCESQIGDSAEAIEHLRRAVEMSDQFLAYAREDSDFDPIRDEPGFKELVGD